MYKEYVRTMATAHVSTLSVGPQSLFYHVCLKSRFSHHPLKLRPFVSVPMCCQIQNLCGILDHHFHGREDRPGLLRQYIYPMHLLLASLLNSHVPIALQPTSSLKLRSVFSSPMSSRLQTLCGILPTTNFFLFFFTSDFYFIRSDQRQRESSVKKKEKMSGEVVKAARVYRDLLKAVVKHIGKEDHKAHFIDFVKQEFRKNAPANSEKMNLARNYAYLLNSIHSHKDLLFSYNIAVDRTEEMKRVLNKSAASVGLRLPEVYES